MNLLNCLLGYVREVIVFVLKGQPCTKSAAHCLNDKWPGGMSQAEASGPHSKLISSAAFSLLFHAKFGTQARSFRVQGLRCQYSPFYCKLASVAAPLPPALQTTCGRGCCSSYMTEEEREQKPYILHECWSLEERN